ncbi:MAG: hypothetical protein ABI725_02430 [Chloroflexota bacterium]
MPAARNQRATNVDYYRRNREREHARIRVRQIGQLEMLRDLRRVPCQDCGGRFEPHQMDFDHRDPATKSFELTKGRVMLMATAKVLAEVAKCDVVCANCHRLRTQRTWVGRPRKGSYTSPSQARKAALWRLQSDLLAELRNVECADCRGKFPKAAMDFDHRDPSTKKHTISRMLLRTTTEEILVEVAKCDVVCANCHRMRTYLRREGAA